MLTDDAGRGCRDSRISGNTIHNRSADNAGVIAQTSGSGTNYAEDNLIYCGGAPPFLVISGRIVQSGNTVLQ